MAAPAIRHRLVVTANRITVRARTQGRKATQTAEAWSLGRRRRSYRLDGPERAPRDLARRAAAAPSSAAITAGAPARTLLSFGASAPAPAAPAHLHGPLHRGPLQLPFVAFLGEVILDLPRDLVSPQDDLRDLTRVAVRAGQRSDQFAGGEREVEPALCGSPAAFHRELPVAGDPRRYGGRVGHRRLGGTGRRRHRRR